MAKKDAKNEFGTKKEEGVREVPAEVAPTSEAPKDVVVDDANDVKFALVAFIAAAAGFFFTALSLVGGIVSLVFQKKIKGLVEKKPHSIFLKIAKPVAIVDLVLGILIIVGLFIWLIVVIIMAIIAAASGAMDGAMQLALFF